MKIITIREAVFKNCAQFTNCISKINSTKIDNAKNIDEVMPMYSLREYSNNHSKTCRILWQYYRDEPPDRLKILTIEH